MGAEGGDLGRLEDFAEGSLGTPGRDSGLKAAGGVGIDLSGWSKSCSTGVAAGGFEEADDAEGAPSPATTETSGSSMSAR